MSETVNRVQCLVSEDGLLSRVALGVEGALLDAAAVEDLIWRLAACRAAMLPRRTATLFEGSRIHMGEAVRVTTGVDGRDITAVMHPGVGWVGMVSSRPLRRSRQAGTGRAAVPFGSPPPS